MTKTELKPIRLKVQIYCIECLSNEENFTVTLLLFVGESLILLQ